MSCCLTLTIEYRFKEIGLWYFLDIIDNRCGSGILFNGQQMAFIDKIWKTWKNKIEWIKKDLVNYTHLKEGA